MVWGWGTRDTVPIAVDNLLENPARYPDVCIMFQIYSVEHSYRLGGELLFFYCFSLLRYGTDERMILKEMRLNVVFSRTEVDCMPRRCCQSLWYLTNFKFKFKFNFIQPIFTRTVYQYIYHSKIQLSVRQ